VRRAWFDSDTETLSAEWFSTVVTYHHHIWLAAMGGTVG